MDNQLNKILEEVTFELKHRGLKIACVESCTGGMLSNLLTGIPGSSEYFECGIIAYSNDAKKRILNVNEESLGKYGAVSSEIAETLAKNMLEISKADISISTTGVAGPDPIENKPVGLVYIGHAYKFSKNKNKRIIAKANKFQFSGNRSENKKLACLKALEEILPILKNI
jgi:PncC family amidohydrolase